MQNSQLSEPPGDVLPGWYAEHGSQVVAPNKGWYVASEQSRHSDCPLAGCALPGAQVVHLVLDAEDTDPAGQGMHPIPFGV